MELLKPSPQPELAADPGHESRLTAAVMSGKGGVGKTTISANLAVAVASRRPGVLLLDCDLNAGQIHLLLGLSPWFGLAQVVRGEKTLKQVLESSNGLHLAPGGPNGGQGLEMGDSHLKKLMGEARLVLDRPTTVILDAGPSRTAVAPEFARSVDLTLVVSTPEPTSIRSTVALLEALCCDCPTARPRILINMASNEGEARATYDRIQGALLPLFEDNPLFFGALPFDPAVPRSVRGAVPFVLGSPESPASQSITRLAESLVRIEADLMGVGGFPVCAEDGEIEGDIWPEGPGEGLSSPGTDGLDEPGTADENDEGDGKARAA